MPFEIEELITEIEGLRPEDKARLRTALAPALDEEEREEPQPKQQEAAGGPVHTMPPRLSNFSGGDSKNDVSYQQWAFEVQGLLQGGIYTEALVLQSIRRSVRGTASDVLLNLPRDASVKTVLGKMERIFGNILPPDKLLELFYSAQQRDGESAAVWACRLEDTVTKLRSSETSSVSQEGAADMLRTKFFSGLRSGTVKNALRHRFDAKATYDDMLVAARVAELEEDKEKEKKGAKVNQATAIETGVGQKLDTILKQLSTMQSRLDNLERNQGKGYQNRGPQEGQQPRKPFSGKCFRCQQEGHRKFECPLNFKQPATGGSGQAATSPAPPK